MLTLDKVYLFGYNRTVANSKKENGNKMKLYLNVDWGAYFWRHYDKGQPINEESILQYVQKFQRSHVTDLIFNVNGTESCPPSNVLHTFIDKYLATDENGVAVNFKDTWASAVYQAFEQLKLDPYKIWFEEAKRLGMRPWISFRMNDVHGNWDLTHILKSPEVEAHPEWWIARHRKAEHYFDKAFDYALLPVRQRMLSYIKEQLTRYDVHGIEMDFKREPYCFCIGKEEEGRALMLEFFRDVKAIVEEIGKSRGKQIKISVICQANPMVAYESGFDIVEIAKQGLVDVVVASPRWSTTNMDVPVELWKKLLPAQTEFAVLQEPNVKPDNAYTMRLVNNDLEHGQVAAHIARGVDSLYVYNVYNPIESDAPVAEKIYSHDTYCCASQEKWGIFMEQLGDLEQLPYLDRRVCVTFDDFQACYQPMTSILPLEVKGVKVIKLYTGKIFAEQQSYFIMETDGVVDLSGLEVYVNGVKAEYTLQEKQDKNLIRGAQVYSFAFRLQTEKCAKVELVSKTPFIITWAEIYTEGLKK